jgi:Amt family ammonium transporter
VGERVPHCRRSSSPLCLQLLLDYRLEKKWSAVGLCSGVIAGLVCITPAAGYVGSPAALAFGVVGAIACNFATGIKTLVGIDDTLDVFALHGIGGLVGNILTAFFADNRVASFDGSDPIDGGWINHNYIQLGYQLADSCSAIGWSFALTMILLFAIDRIPGMHFRCSEDDEIVGIDMTQIGEECFIIPNAPVYRDIESGGLVAGHEQKSQHSTGSQEKVGEAPQQVV